MPKKTIIDTENELKLINLYENSNLSVKELLLQFHINRNRLNEIFVRNNVKLRKHKRSRFFDEKEKKILIEKYNCGIGVRKLSAEFRCAIFTIENLLKENNIPIRKYKDWVEIQNQIGLEKKYIHISKNVYSRWKGNAIDRNLVWEINPSDIEEQYQKQNGKCYYTNVDLLSNFRKRNTIGKSDPETISLDRKDSSKGYTKDNIVLCCIAINLAKNDYNIIDFQNFINKIKYSSKNEEKISVTEESLHL